MEGGVGGRFPSPHWKFPQKIIVPNIYVLRGYAVKRLRIWYCIINYTHQPKTRSISKRKYFGICLEHEMGTNLVGVC